MLDDLRRLVFFTLASVSNHTTLTYFYRYKQKIYLYHKRLGYGSLQWKTRIAHHKPFNKGDDRGVLIGVIEFGGVYMWRICGTLV